MKNEYPENVVDAAKLLDTVKPDWYNKIEISELDMGCSEHCILGQLYDDYGDGLESVFGVENNEKFSEDDIFGKYTNSNEWITEILRRRTTMLVELPVWAIDELIESLEISEPDSLFELKYRLLKVKK